VLLGDCVAIKHESPTLVVLDAKMFLVDLSEAGRSVENDYIWDAVNGFILQGYNVDSVVLSSAQVNNEPNPHEFTVVMSKSPN
jgi:hypothetical protein